MAINVTRWSFALLVLLSILPSVFGLYFYLEGAEQKCFTEELPSQTIVIGEYAAEEWNEDTKQFVKNKDSGIEVVVEEMPEGKRVFSQKLAASGKFKFTSSESGTHAICIFSTASGWFDNSKTRITLDLAIRDIGDDGDAPEGTLSELAMRVRDLNDRVDEIRREQAYLREHEKEF
ncbi:emp24p/erv25p- protein, partial [Lunasporangiospora selenospora]